MLLDLSDAEKNALLELLLATIQRRQASPQTDLLHSVLAKIGADTPAEPTDPAAPLDEAVLMALRELQRDGQPDVVTIVVSLFEQSVPEILSELVAAAASEDVALLQSATHKLRGISANVGARLLSGRCRQLEATARMGSIPENAASQIDAITREYERAKAALAGWRAPHASTITD